MDVLSRVIKKILNQTPSLKQGVNDARIIDTWAPAVGETIAKHAKAVQVKNKTLIVEVDHPIWKQELLSNKVLALQKLNDKICETLSEESPKVWIEDLFLTNLSAGTRSRSKQQPTKSKQRG